jgi:hypothetical protein
MRLMIINGVCRVKPKGMLEFTAEGCEFLDFSDNLTDVVV